MRCSYRRGGPRRQSRRRGGVWAKLALARVAGTYQARALRDTKPGSPASPVGGSASAARIARLLRLLVAKANGLELMVRSHGAPCFFGPGLLPRAERSWARANRCAAARATLRRNRRLDHLAAVSAFD